MHDWPELGLALPDILLPCGIDYEKWAVVACDQFTAQGDYWKSVEEFVQNYPSTLHIMLPEIYLEDENVSDRIALIESTMKRYEKELLQPIGEGTILVSRTYGDKTRTGLMMCVDLEKYEYALGTKPLIRCTEGTIVDRIPPRLRIRERASLELPHVLLLIDDPEKTVIEPLIDLCEQTLYDFDLMCGGGRVCGKYIDFSALGRAKQALSDLYDKYINENSEAFLFAVGDGNHSLATAKAYWENLKASGASMDHPARYALVEIENIHDDGIEFEPIHRVLFDVPNGAFERICEIISQNNSETPMTCGFEIEYVTPSGKNTMCLPSERECLSALQRALDQYLTENSKAKLDYVHGDDVAAALGNQPGNIAFILPAMRKENLFPSIIDCGTLPRKAFSMGNAPEKRYYIECRKIT